jgi:hypothetical protein
MKIEGTAKHGYLHCRLNQNKQVFSGEIYENYRVVTKKI